METFLHLYRRLSPGTILLAVGVLSLCIGSALVSMDRQFDEPPQALEELPSLEALNSAVAAGEKPWPLQDSEKEVVIKVSKQLQRRKSDSDREYQRLQQFHRRLRLHASEVFFGGAFTAFGGSLFGLGVLWLLPWTAEWIQRVLTNTAKQAAELARREKELGQKAESLDRREARLEEEKREIPERVELLLKQKILWEVQPRESQLEAAERRLKVEEEALKAAKEEAKELLASAAQVREERAAAQALLDEADTKSGQVKASLDALARKETKIANMINELRALITANKETKQ